MKKLYLGLSKGSNFGWGVCSAYLNREIRRLYAQTELLDEICSHVDPVQVEGAVLHALTDEDLNPLYRARGEVNFGYTFIESDPTERTVENARDLELVFCGSSWKWEKLQAAGVKNARVLLQGVDGQRFFYSAPKQEQDGFVIFSGGKFEFRKGQDLVIRAVAYLQEKYDDVILVCGWYNPWPQTMLTMGRSKWIRWVLRGRTMEELLRNILEENGIKMDRTVVLGEVPHERYREIYHSTDLGLFPNRCEGGTNLVLMEYLASGRPVIATYATGQQDVLTEEVGYLLRNNRELRIEEEGRVRFDWVEPDLDEIVAWLEHARENREELRRKGVAANEAMKKFSWERSAQSFLKAAMPYLLG